MLIMWSADPELLVLLWLQTDGPSFLGPATQTFPILAEALSTLSANSVGMRRHWTTSLFDM